MEILRKLKKGILSKGEKEILRKGVGVGPIRKSGKKILPGEKFTKIKKYEPLRSRRGGWPLKLSFWGIP